MFEDDRVAIALHDDWSVRGHAMMIWKDHIENISDLSAAELEHFARVYHNAERALLRITGADRAVMLKLGIATPHLHLHIYPVSAALDRAAVFGIIDGRTREPRDTAFVEAAREALTIRLG